MAEVAEHEGAVEVVVVVFIEAVGGFAGMVERGRLPVRAETVVGHEVVAWVGVGGAGEAGDFADCDFGAGGDAGVDGGGEVGCEDEEEDEKHGGEGVGCRGVDLCG